MSESGAAAPSGPVSGAGGEPPKKPNDNGEKKGEKGKKPSYGRCAACGSYAHQGPCWRPCNLCGRRHNLRKACPRGAQQEFSGGFLANPPVIPPSPYGVGLGFGGAPAGYGTSQYQVMMGHLGAYVQSSLAVLGTAAGPGFAAAPGGFKAQVGAPGGKFIEAPAAEQPPTAAQSTPSDAKKKRKNRRQAKRQRREAQKAKEGEKKEGAEGEMDLDDKATQQQLPERSKSPPGGPAEPVEKSQTS